MIVVIVIALIIASNNNDNSDNKTYNNIGNADTIKIKIVIAIWIVTC